MERIHSFFLMFFYQLDVPTEQKNMSIAMVKYIASQNIISRLMILVNKKELNLLMPR